MLSESVLGGLEAPRAEEVHECALAVTPVTDQADLTLAWLGGIFTSSQISTHRCFRTLGFYAGVPDALKHNELVALPCTSAARGTHLMWSSLL